MSYDRYDRRQRRVLAPGPSNRSVFGYWVPLIVTVTAATIAIGAWVWSERRDSDDDYTPGETEDERYARRLREQRRQVSRSRSTEEFFEVGPGGVMIDKHGRQIDMTDDEQERGVADPSGNTTIMSKMSDAIRRTPSPQQIYDGASRSFAAGVAAVGKGLRSIQEEGKDDYVDHEMWSEEAEHKDKQEDTRDISAAAAIAPTQASRSDPTVTRQTNGRKRLVAVVISSENAQAISQDEDESSYHIEHASVLSHLINRVNPDEVDLLVLIYAPHLKTHPLANQKRRPSSSGDSTFSHISGREADTADYNNVFNALHTQATALTAHPTHVMPFTTPNGHVHILRHIAPSLVYLQESLSGDNGELVKQIDGWVGQVVVVVGADVGAGLIDTETEDESERKEKKQWWRDEKRVGLGKGVEVVDSDRVGDDWSKRLAH